MKIMKAALVTLWMVLLLDFNRTSQAQALARSTKGQANSVVKIVAESQGLPVMPLDQLPRYGTYWEAFDLYGRLLPPMPFQPLNPNFVVYQMTDGQFLVDNGQATTIPQPLRRSKLPAMTPAEFVQGQVDALESLIAQIREAEKNQQALTVTGLDESFSLMGASRSYSFTPSQFTADDLWLEVLSVDLTNLQASLRLHGTVDTDNYQILYTNRVETPGNGWTLGPILPGTGGTNQTDFWNIPIGTNSQMFYRAHQANPVIYIDREFDAFEPTTFFGGQDGWFRVTVSGQTTDLPVYYRISGTASNGIDYTNLSGVVTIPASLGYADIYVHPIQDNLVEGIETVTLTLIQTNDYLIQPWGDSATVKLFDSPITVSIWAEVPIAIEPDGPPGVGAQAGVFRISRDDVSGIYPSMDVFYQVSGTASNGGDYSALNGLIHLAAGIPDTYLDITPSADTTLEGAETVTLTLEHLHKSCSVSGV